MSKIAKFYTISTLTGLGNYLLPDDDAYIIENEVRDFLSPSSFGEPQTQRGLLNLPPKELLMRTEIEGETEHYGNEEIQRSLKSSVLMEYNNLGANLYLVSKRFIDAITTAGITEYVAQPCAVRHNSTNRQWDYWFFSYTYSINKKEVKGDDLYFTDMGTTAYYSKKIKDAIAALEIPHLEYTEHSLAVS